MNNKTQYEQDMEICRAATDGPWFATEDWGGACYINVDSDAEPTVAQTSGGIKGADVDALYIAHFNPQRVIQILERQRGLEELFDERDEALNKLYESGQLQCDMEEIVKATLGIPQSNECDKCLEKLHSEKQYCMYEIVKPSAPCEHLYIKQEGKIKQ